MNEPHIIIFDGICNLCCGWVQFLIREDKKEFFKFASLQSECAEGVLKPFGIVAKNSDTLIYIRGENCLQESTAVLEILTDLGGIWKLFGVFKLIPKTIRDQFYRIIASLRYKVFGKRENCIIPTTNIQKRFLT